MIVLKVQCNLSLKLNYVYMTYVSWICVYVVRKYEILHPDWLYAYSFMQINIMGSPEFFKANVCSLNEKN